MRKEAEVSEGMDQLKKDEGEKKFPIWNLLKDLGRSGMCSSQRSRMLAILREVRESGRKEKQAPEMLDPSWMVREVRD